MRSLFPMDDVVAGGRFLTGLPMFLRRPSTHEQARATLRRRLERREPDFLELVQRTIYRNPTSPYRPLLNLAGCQYGDLTQLVCQRGVEGALGALFRHGVFLTVDEFKGRRPIIRGGTTIAFDPGQLRNPGAVPHVLAQSSGSRGTGTQLGIDFADVRDQAVDFGLFLDACGDTGWRHAVWGVPGSAAIRNLLLLSNCGASTAAWFSQVDPSAPGLHPRYRWSARLMRWGSLLAGVPLPYPQHVSLENPLPIVRWMADTIQHGRTPQLYAFSSSAVRVCRTASEVGIDLDGARFFVGGEPITEARLRAVRQAGAEVVPRYGSVETGHVGYGCLAPDFPDDLHVLHDSHALIQPGPDGVTADLPAQALLVSCLRPNAPLVMLNVSMGDEAILQPRHCGCPLEGLRWATHLHTIRSYEKLTAGGMTFLDARVIQILEELLPSRFGGRPTDYQLLEEEDRDGEPRLRLLVHPAVGRVDVDAVAKAFWEAIGPGSGVERVMALSWRGAGFLRVERLPPLATASGKILHLHQNRGSLSRMPHAKG